MFLGRRRKILVFALTLWGMACAIMLKAQTANLETFGQNRIQTRKFVWKFFDTRHFRIYHYDKAGVQLARYVAEEAEREITEVEKKLGGQFPKRFNLILYNSYDEYKQTNVGLKLEGQTTGSTPTGTIDIVGDKLVIYFTGQHADLKRQILTGMSKVVMQRLVFGENVKQMVKNAVFLNLPEWVTLGYIAYLVDGWDTKSNTQWKELIEANPNKGFFELSEKNPELAGKAFWKFVAKQYGNKTVKGLLYTIEQKANLNKGMKEPQTLDMKVTKAYDSCMVFYRKAYATDALIREEPDSTKGLIKVDIPVDNTLMRNVKVSPKGNDIAYITWKEGEFFVWIQNTRHEQQKALILEGGRKDYMEKPDPDYPIITWSNNGLKLGILFKKDGKLRLRIYNSLKARVENYTIPAKHFDRVLGMSFLEDDNQMVFSAIKKSQTDLYEFTIPRSKMRNITNDAWDDLQPWFISGGSRKGILFLSNRPKPNLNVPLQVNELPTGPLNVYFYDTKTQRSELLQCSNMKNGLVSQPIQYGSDNFAFLYDSNGIQNKYVVMFGRDRKNKDSAYAVPITNYSENIISHQYNPASNNVADVIQEGNAYKVYFHKLLLLGVNVDVKNLSPTLLSVPDLDNLSEIKKSQAQAAPKPKSNTTVNNSGKPEIKSGNYFQSDFFDDKPQAPVAANVKLGTINENGDELKKADVVSKEDVTDSSFMKVINDSAYLKMKPLSYRLNIKPDFITVKMDNSILFNQYQSIAATGGTPATPTLGGLVTMSMNDVFENHKFTAGYQLPSDMNGSAYFLEYDNFTRRVDWGLLFLRSVKNYSEPVNYIDTVSGTLTNVNWPLKSVTNLLQANFSYPFDHVRSLRFHTALRLDELYVKVIDPVTLTYDLPQDQKLAYWNISRLEFVFDNTINPTMNIWNGFRYKFYTEYMYKLNGASSCYNFGLDFRYYKKIYKNFIWAHRLAYGHSDGNAQVMYSLGGVDNWIGGTTNSSLQPEGGPYAFQTLATGLRGYIENSRAGNNFALYNTEFRLPVFSTFLKRPIQSSLLRNFQLIGFLDAGSAWAGFLPNADNLSLQYTYATTTQINPVVLQLTVPSSLGLAMGYGVGARTTLLSYFLRLDAAWNIEGIKKPMWFFSLGTDF
jgi:hypothetical protein